MNIEYRTERLNDENWLIITIGTIEYGFSAAYLYNTDLANADLYNANLAFANLKNADLYNAYLYNANLENADLTNTNLENADLTNTNLAFANLANAYLYNTDLAFANLKNADLYNANLAFANLTFANLENAYLKNADLENANLENVTMNWQSHALIGERLRQAAGDRYERLALAGGIANNPQHCFDYWLTRTPLDVREWALREMMSWRKDGDVIPPKLKAAFEKLEVA